MDPEKFFQQIAHMFVPPVPQGQAFIDEIKRRGAHLKISRCDAANPDT